MPPFHFLFPLEAPVVHGDDSFSFLLRWRGSGGAFGRRFEGPRCGGREWAGCAALFLRAVLGALCGRLFLRVSPPSRGGGVALRLRRAVCCGACERCSDKSGDGWPCAVGVRPLRAVLLLLRWCRCVGRRLLHGG
ncbi:hypothetical protein TraAM80_09752 [Trypanosoma rangeli]|uniref:Uncharacterized protein n=1 Tax=Trypanosoma rangeli TaxID=5698 RepID=A0A422MTS7_TRYRA|nr:uncharacterized protein TraAM80_09752 [Trypanosoma rangeli]RNE96586.1 hypothetical protein TraAM80_09752 [Trypanosoma rangeli]|eukprot:RNE96586.1 hypothetical protein TraAM80_09752 [Trypanosoma rangeli]